MEITTIGLDLAKNIFQVHGIDASGQVVVRKSLRRAQMLPFFARLPSCLVGMEARGTSHHWARELIKLGHEVRLMSPAYVKPYVTGQDRRCRCGSGLRSGKAADDAVRSRSDVARQARPGGTSVLHLSVFQGSAPRAVTPRRARPHPQAGQAGRFSAGAGASAFLAACRRSICPTVFELIYLIGMS